MRISLKSNMGWPDIPPELELDKATAGDVIRKVFGELAVGKEFINPKTGEMNLEDMMMVEINSVPYTSLPKGLDTELKNEDEIIFILPFSGG